MTGQKIIDEVKKIEPIDVTEGKSIDEVLNDIWTYEKEQRNIDWMRLYEEGKLEPFKIIPEVKEYLEKRGKELHITRERVDEIIKGIQYVEPWTFSESAAKKWAQARGSDIKELIVRQLRNLQVIEGSDAPAAIAGLMIGAGVLAVGFTEAKVLSSFLALRGAREGWAVINSVMELGINVIKFFAAVIVAGILIPLAILMLKDAIAYMVIVNHTPSDFVLEEDPFFHDGKQVVGFRIEENSQRVIPGKKEIRDPDGNLNAVVYSAGLFIAKKKDGALVGTSGALKFKRNAHAPHGLHIGWEVPLTGIHGWNRCGVSMQEEESLKSFWEREINSVRERLEAGDSSGKAKTIVRVNKKTHDQGYLIASIINA
ncbi:MAG: hypothetical protein JXB88_24720 [Spirochaetales bacterium]|nr:hypothetical protein [Spirochaetales bacterium]